MQHVAILIHKANFENVAVGGDEQEVGNAITRENQLVHSICVTSLIHIYVWKRNLLMNNASSVH